jgi:hypothetical protein
VRSRMARPHLWSTRKTDAENDFVRSYPIRVDLDYPITASLLSGVNPNRGAALRISSAM